MTVIGCVRTSAGAIPARVVVVASGYTRLPYLPKWPGDFDGPVVHSTDYRNPRPYRGQDVLVVGAGTAAPRSPSIWRREALDGFE